VVSRPSFLPYLSRLQVARLSGLSRERTEPAAERFKGALLFLDGSGFTALTEELDRRGLQGAEHLSEVLSAYFEPVLEEIERWHGDVLLFAGDALLALWEAGGEGAPSAEAACEKAAAAALALQERVARVHAPHGVAMSFRASVGFGELRAAEVGGMGGRWMQLVDGEPLDQVRTVDRSTRAGAVMVSASAARLLEACGATFRSLGDEVRWLRALPPMDPPTARSTAEAPEDVEARVATCIPRVVVDRVSSGQSGFLAEFRRVTVVFLGLEGVHDVERLDRAVRIVQEETARYEGVIDQLISDEKGISVLSAFGLPGTSHADDPVRGALTARAIRERLAAEGFPCTAGVSTGTVLCGPLGSELRRHYSLLGTTINLAARLMQIAGEEGVLCDDATRVEASDRVHFHARGSISLKGFEGPVGVHVPGARFDAPGPRRTHALVGRTREAAALTGRIETLAGGGPGGALILEGSAGMGKSTLLAHAAGTIAELDVHYAHGSADSLEVATPYYAFRTVVRGLFGIPPDAAPGQARDRVDAELPDGSTFGDLKPLLDGILGLDYEENALTRQMRGSVRAENLHALLMHVVRRRVEERPLVVVLEDAHWMDSASWSLTAGMLDATPQVLLVLSTRPLDTIPEELEKLLGLPTAERLTLGPIGLDEVVEIIRREVGVSSVSDDVARGLAERSGGNPYYLLELIRAVHELGVLRVANGRAELDDAEHGLDQLPATLGGVITARVDRLPSRHQLTLKVAAVLGQQFEKELLRRVHPTHPDDAELEAELGVLLSAQLIVADDEMEGLGHRFTHALTHEATYRLLPFAQRKVLHRSAAEALEDMHRDSLELIHGRLAQHFRLAELPDRALPHLAQAGQQALDAFASREAIEFLTTALEIDRRLRGSLKRCPRRTRWSRQIGEAWFSLNDHGNAREWYERAVDHASAPLPRNGLLAVGAMVRWVLNRMTQRIVGHGTRDAERREVLVEALGSMKELGTVHLFEGEQTLWLHNSINMAWLADRVGASPESPHAIVQFAGLMQLFGLRGFAHREGERAVAMAEELGELMPIASVNVVWGMIQTAQGSPDRALPYLERARAAADDLNTGLWKHRVSFMHGEALFFLARHDEAAAAFGRAAHRAVDAEPHVGPFARCMAALALLRLGRAREARTALESETGVEGLRRVPVVLSLVCGLGALAEVRWEDGDAAGALEAIHEAESVLRPTDDGTGYFIGISGHAGIVRVLLEMIEDRESGAIPGLEASLDAALSRVRKMARYHGGVRARLLLLEGLRDALAGRRGRARRRLLRAVTVSRTLSLPYDSAWAHIEAARMVEGPQREELARTGLEIFERHGMALDRDRALSRLGRDLVNVIRS